MSEMEGHLRTFVRSRGKAREFWNILLHVSQWGYTVSSGTSGQGEQEQTDCEDDDEARAEFDDLIAEKLAEGFVEATNEPWHGGFDSKLRGTFEQALAEDFDDLATHRAYADHLMELGDPRGEFISVQLALEDEAVAGADRKERHRREQALLDRHARAWLGPLAAFWVDRMDTTDWMDDPGYPPNDYGWRRGWVHSLSFNGCSPHVVEAVRRSLPRLRCLRELRLLGGRYDEDRHSFYELSGGQFFGNVRLFQVGEVGTQNYSYGVISSGDFFRKGKMPRLEELHLYNGDTPFKENFPHLRKLTAHHGRGVYDLKGLAANKSLTNLTHLACWPRGQSNEEPWQRNPDGGWAYITRTQARALFRSPNLPRLQHLQLRNSDIGDEGIRDLIKSGLLGRLKSLDLLGGCVTDVGAGLLAACPDLRNLEALDLSQNMLTQDGLAALTATGVALTANHQFGPEALETRAYLFSGDCE
jgi:uncharacterized protein (TIGR02996 family)